MRQTDCLPTMLKRYAGLFTSLAVAAVLGSLLYIPFLHSALIFDDHNLFTNLLVYDYATTPISSKPRTFPYFTLGIVQVLSGSIEVQRMVSLVLHLMCGFFLFALLKSLLDLTRGENAASAADPSTRYVLPFVGAAWFILNPVAVYGAGYLVQRTIVFATLFALACLWIFVRAFRNRSTTDVVLAAVLYSIAVFCKEHAVMLPLAALPLIALTHERDWNWDIRRAFLFLLLCFPVAITAVLAAKAVIASSYEPYVGDVISQAGGVGLFGQPGSVWFASMAIQAREFFVYVYYWLIPDLRFMSADMRIDFSQLLRSPMLAVSAAAFLALPLLGMYSLSRGKARALFGCGLLFSWMLFMTELASVRLQEPLVFYRSYLWAPGYAMMLVAVLSRMQWRWVLALFIVCTPIQFYLSQDRLRSLSSEQSVWEDAAAKLSTPDLPGADRIFYNRGGERFKRGHLKSAMDDLNKVVSLNPTALHGYLGRGMIYLQEKKYAEALVELDRALSFKPDFGFALYRRGVALENLGREEDALAAYRKAAKAGDTLAQFRVTYLEKMHP
jgi:hypothetical protein